MTEHLVERTKKTIELVESDGKYTCREFLGDQFSAGYSNFDDEAAARKLYYQLVHGDCPRCGDNWWAKQS